MAESLKIETKQNTVKIIVDGNEIHDVLSYFLEESNEERTLVLRVAIRGSVEALAQ